MPLLLIAAALLLIVIVVVVLIVPWYWGGKPGEGFDGSSRSSAETIISSIPTPTLVSTFERWTADVKRMADRVAATGDTAASQRFAAALAAIESASTTMATARQMGEAATAALAAAFTEVSAPKMSEADAVAWLLANFTQRGPNGSFADQYQAVQNPTSIANWSSQPLPMQHFIVLNNWLQVKQQVFYLMHFGPPTGAASVAPPAVAPPAVAPPAVAPPAAAEAPLAAPATPAVAESSRAIGGTVMAAPSEVVAPQTIVGGDARRARRDMARRKLRQQFTARADETESFTSTSAPWQRADASY
jgi:hypothetical protein